jgi:3-deoxy-D-manno-octulosonic-acid transferase
MLLFFYTAALYLAVIVGAPFWLYRLLTTEKYRHGLRERLGRIPARVLDAVGSRPVIWVHAVSVGEVLAAGRLISDLQARAPDCRVLVSTTTRTSQELARKKYGDDRVFYFPLDFNWAVRRYLDAFRPALVVLLETEFWPNFLAACRSRGIPVAVVNARISDRSYPRYLRLRSQWKKILGGLNFALAQTAEDQSRLVAIGMDADRVRVGGNLKFDVRSPETARITEEIRNNLPPHAKLVVAGSTLEGEESMLVRAWPHIVAAFPEARMVMAPRHPERFTPVAALLKNSGLPWTRRSEWITAPCKLPPGSILLLDSIGELASVYSLATIAVVGGSFIPAGGHNPLEPAQFAIPVVMGPHYTNFRGIVETLRAENAVSIAREDQFEEFLIDMLNQPVEGILMGRRAQIVFGREAGATDRALEELLKLLPGEAM